MVQVSWLERKVQKKEKYLCCLQYDASATVAWGTASDILSFFGFNDGRSDGPGSGVLIVKRSNRGFEYKT